MSYLSDLLGDSYKEGMTEEEISTALQAAGAGQNNDAEINRLKAQLSKANSEAADYKKQLRGKQTADEAAAAEQKATMQKLKLLVQNPFYPSLRTKKVQGFLDVFEMSVNMDIRILWRYENGTIILLLEIGHHKDILGL